MNRARIRYALAVALTWVLPTGVATASVVLQLDAKSPPASATSTFGIALATKYAPALRLDSDEKLKPINRDMYVAATALWAVFERKRGRNTRSLLLDKVTLTSLPTTPLKCPPVVPAFDECHFYLRVRGLAVSSGPRAFQRLQSRILDQTGQRPVVYWYYDPKEAVLQYWFFYVFNYFLNWHEGDWEQITIGFDPNSVGGDPADARPTLIGFSSHGSGQAKAWNELSKGKQIVGTSPVVYVARRSHANYFRTGLHPVPVCKYQCNDRSNGKQTPLTSAEYTLKPLTRPPFAGDYGSGNFLLGGIKRIKTGINVPDPLSGQRKDPRAWLDHTGPADDGSRPTVQP